MTQLWEAHFTIKALIHNTVVTHIHSVRACIIAPLKTAEADFKGPVSGFLTVNATKKT